jgi:hypothetical protein
MAALFIGGSNADRLANAAASLGIVAETVNRRRLDHLYRRRDSNPASSDWAL